MSKIKNEKNEYKKLVIKGERTLIMELIQSEINTEANLKQKLTYLFMHTFGILAVSVLHRNELHYSNSSTHTIPFKEKEREGW